jgi:hypothetical protein
MVEQEFANKYCIFRCRAGSHAYGTALPTSDTDTRGVFIAPPSHVLSCIHTVEQVENKQTDTTIFELRKFLSLASDVNPNIIELLFTGEENILFITDEFREIRDHRHLFLSKKAKHTFSGYAMSQLNRIKGHKKWIMNPQPQNAPKLADFCRFIGLDGIVEKDAEEIRSLSEECFLASTFGTTQFRVFREFFSEKLGFFDEREKQPRFVNVDDLTLSEKAEFVGFLWVNMEEFKMRYKEWKQYWGWKKNRNPDRAKLEEQFKYDVKHAMHLVRLMRMAEEILRDGQVIVRRPDAQELLAIRNGKFDYDELIQWATETDARLLELYEKSTLPYTADYEGIDELYRRIVLQYWKKHNLIPPQ